MRLNRFVTLIFVLALSASAQAQQPKKISRLGFLISGSAFSTKEGVRTLRKGLGELGYVEGNNISIEYRYADNKFDRLPELAEELVRLKVDLIFAWAGPAIQAAKNATKTIPIVMGPNADPVASGLVRSLARPGGNITGVSLMGPDLAGKRLELLSETVPKLSRVALLVHGGSLGQELHLKEAKDAAAKLGMEVQPLVLRAPQELENTFSAMVRERSGALVVQSILVGSGGQGRRVAELAAKHRLPTVSDNRSFPQEGGLMFYGPSSAALWRRIPVYVDKILKGAKPADLPVEQPTKFEFVINLTTAKQIGLTIPESVLFRADNVIK